MTPKKKPVKAVKPVAEAKPPPASTGFLIPDLMDPLEALGDILSGKIFEAPQALAAAATEGATDDADAREDEQGEDDGEGAAAASAGPNININLGDLFKRTKPKQSKPGSVAPAGTEGQPATGK